MECFYHAGAPAVGTCKSCGRGICRQCAVGLSFGLACRDHCEADAQAVIDLVQANIRVRRPVQALMKANRVAYVVAAIFIAIFGAFFLWVGATAGENRLWVLVGLGALLLAWGGYMLVRARRYVVPE